MKVAFDLDDTLIHTRWLYNRAMHQCACFVIEQLKSAAPYSTDLLEGFEEVDQQVIKEAGYSVERYADSWERYYRQLCQDAGVYPCDTLALRKLASMFLDGPFLLIDGAVEVLKEVSREHDVYIVTAGDATFQNRKVSMTGLDCVVPRQNTRTVERSKTETLRELEVDVMVGDSLRSDVQAALAAGCQAVRIPTKGHWAHDDADVGSHYTVRSIRDVPTILKVIEQEVSRVSL